MIVLWIILYIIMGILVGVGCYVFLNDFFDDDALAFFAGVMWPVTTVVLICGWLISLAVKGVYAVMTYLKNEGYHYYKEDLAPCCGKCKYAEYTGNTGTTIRCKRSLSVYTSSLKHPCDKYTQHCLWRFTIRVDDKQ